MWGKKIYYAVKPAIPRWLQIAARRMVIRRQLQKYPQVWPIDERAAEPPKDWTGWPQGKRFALVLTHDVETSVGQRKCRDLAELEQRLGFRSSFNFVAEDFEVSRELRRYLGENGFEIGVHGLSHKGNLFQSKATFQRQAAHINRYLEEWGAVGFRTPSMYHNLEWLHDLNIEYDSSTFDTDPFEPQPDGVATIFPFWVGRNGSREGYVELPYTLPQDFTLFILMKEKNIDTWKEKLDWVAEKGGMALLITHPDYMNGKNGGGTIEEYPTDYYREFLDYVNSSYEGQYWNVLPKEMSLFWKETRVGADKNVDSDSRSKPVTVLSGMSRAE